MFTYTYEHQTPYTCEYIEDVYIDYSLEETDEWVLDYPTEVSETPNPSPKTILVQLPNNYLYGEHLNTYWCYRFFITCGLIDSLEIIEFLTTADIDLDKIHKLFRKYFKNLTHWYNLFIKDI